jgi:hypothetical protein
MGMSIEEAEKLLDDLATQEELLCKRADDASGYTRSGNESIRTSNAKTHEQHAKEYRQILRYMAEYRLMQADYNARLKADMGAMLEELKAEIEELEPPSTDDYEDEETVGIRCGLIRAEKHIQEKINALKEKE